MSKFIAAAKGFAKGEEGATMVEYGLMVALIAVVCIVAVTALGTNPAAMFTSDRQRWSERAARHSDHTTPRKRSHGQVHRRRQGFRQG